jgi:hypothetical protein
VGAELFRADGQTKQEDTMKLIVALMNLEFFEEIFGKKHSNIKFHENPSNGSRVVPCGQTGQKDTIKLIVALINLEFF